MSLYADYLRERTNDQVLELEDGFATYRYINDGKSVYIVDIYTVPTSRNKGRGALLADAVADAARAKGCTEMIGSVVPSTNGSTASVRVLLAYGMELLSAGQDYILFRKEL